MSLSVSGQRLPSPNGGRDRLALNYSTVAGLCYEFNHATSPYVPRTEREHSRMRSWARAMRNRLRRILAIEGWHYFESANGSLHPMPRFPVAGRIS